VPPEEYFLLSTRLEVLEIAAELLHTAQQLRGQNDVLFDEDDYVVRN
jgi:hypothetical protein